MAAGRGGPALSVSTDSKKILLATGYSGYENNDIHIYDIDNKSWIMTTKGQYRARSVCPYCTLEISSKNLFIIFGGEVNTSDRGHEGAGDFADDLIAIDDNGYVINTVNTGDIKPIARGWTSMTKIDTNKALLFGGLSGNDDNPTRHNDLWLLEIV